MDKVRLRPFGQIRSEKLKERKDNFVLQLDAGCCPGCGVKLQCTDKMALGSLELNCRRMGRGSFLFFLMVKCGDSSGGFRATDFL